MKQKPEKKHAYNRNLAAVCGLFCPACTLFIGSSEDPKRLEPIARQYGKKAEEIRCEGCRSDVRFLYCKTCKMDRCATEKGVEFCGSCKEYPCEEIRTFQAAMPHGNGVHSTNEAGHDPEVHRNIVARSRFVAGWRRDRNEPRLCGLQAPLCQTIGRTNLA